ncbi:hypothetical protein GGG16DRAFT_109049 [Schizophyllum commune]
MKRKRTKATSSLGCPVRGKPTTSKRHQKTSGTHPEDSLRRSLRIRKIQESVPRSAHHGYDGTPAAQASASASKKQQPSTTPSPHKARPRRACAHYGEKTSSGTSSNDSSPTSALSDEDADSDPELDDEESDSAASSAVSRARHTTPPINITKSTRRPTRRRLVEKSPLGSTDVITWLNDSNGILQDCHLINRAHAWHFPEVVRGLELLMAMLPETLNLDGTGNRVLLEPSTHGLMDRGKLVFFPERRVLRRLLRALQQLPLIPAAGQVGPIRRNAAGFPHHKDVFPEETWLYHIALLSSYTGQQPLQRQAAADGSVPPTRFSPPWDVPFHMAEMHCSPYLVVWTAYKWLKKPDVHAPAHLDEEESLVREIGQIMWDHAGLPDDYHY